MAWHRPSSTLTIINFVGSIVPGTHSAELLGLGYTTAYLSALEIVHHLGLEKDCVTTLYITMYTFINNFHCCDTLVHH